KRIKDAKEKKPTRPEVISSEDLPETSSRYLSGLANLTQDSSCYSSGLTDLAQEDLQEEKSSSNKRAKIASRAAPRTASRETAPRETKSREETPEYEELEEE
ncbi:10686_t:CDS:1, partial [Racocetra fulgida]